MDLTHYDVLGVPPRASAADIKAAFHAAALRAHPDKAGAEASSPAATAAFLRIQRAWEVLRDPVSRSAYDAQLGAGSEALSLAGANSQSAGAASSSSSAAAGLHVSDEVELADFEELPQGELGDGVPVLSYSCRCGGAYQVPLDDVQCGAGGASSLVLPCTSCSLRIRLLLPGGR